MLPGFTVERLGIFYAVLETENSSSALQRSTVFFRKHKAEICQEHEVIHVH